MMWRPRCDLALTMLTVLQRVLLLTCTALLSGCAVLSVAGTAVSVAGTVAGSAVSAGIGVAGKVVEAGIELATPGKKVD